MNKIRPKGLSYFYIPGIRYRTESEFSQAVVRNACKVYEITMDELTGPARKRHLTDARKAIVHVIKENTKKLSLYQIGNLINRDHATVIYSMRHAKYLMSYDKKFKERVHTLATTLNLD